MRKEEHIKYLLTNEQDTSWGIVTTTVGYQDIEANSPYPSTTHPSSYIFSSEKGRILNEYQLIYITRGSGKFVSDHHPLVQIKSGDIFLLFPGEWHSYCPDKKTGWYEYWIGFTGHDIDSKIESNFFSKSNPLINIGYNSEFVRLFQFAAEVAREQKPGFQQVLAGIINYLLGLCYSKQKSNSFEGERFVSHIDRAKVIMLENVCSNLSGEEVASQVGMSYSSFRRIFKQYTGFSPASYMIELKINKGKELLTHSNLSCQEISYNLGMCSPSHFLSVFRKKTGMTPYQYRIMTQGRMIQPLLSL